MSLLCWCQTNQKNTAPVSGISYLFRPTCECFQCAGAHFPITIIKQLLNCCSVLLSDATERERERERERETADDHNFKWWNTNHLSHNYRSLFKHTCKYIYIYIHIYIISITIICIANQKSMVYPLAFSAHTPWSAAPDFSSLVACLITKKGYGIQREMKGRQISDRLTEGVICANCDRDGLVRHFLP